MPAHFTIPVTYFLQEGKENLVETLKAAFSAARQHSIKKVVIFTSLGEGVRIAIQDFCSQPEYSNIRLVAVTFPIGKKFTDKEGKELVVEMSSETRAMLQEHKVPLVRAHLPFDPIASPFKERGVLGQDLSLVDVALGIFGGSMSLCVQAILLACDAGCVELGEHVISLTSDTAILAKAAATRLFLTKFVVREILCKPAVLTIGKGERKQIPASEEHGSPPTIEGSPDSKKLQS